VLTKRIIPCLDVKEGRVVKGVNFLGLRDAGDPVQLAAAYDAQGADELVFLDITASHEKRDLIFDLAARVAEEVFIPFTVGGGIRFLELRDAGDPVEQAAAYDAQGADEICFLDISASPEGRDTMVDVVARTADFVFCPLTVGGGVRSVEDARRLLAAGADKVAMNTAAIRRPELVAECALRFGNQAIVVAVDAKRQPDGRYTVYSHGGRTPEGLEAIEWCRKVAELGAGEILLTSMDRDGTRQGYELELTRRVVDAVPVPVIASGGVGELAHFVDGFERGGADAVLAASIFHYGEHTIAEAKAFVAARGVPVRLADGLSGEFAEDFDQ